MPELCSTGSLSFFDGLEGERNFQAANRFDTHTDTVVQQSRHVLTQEFVLHEKATYILSPFMPYR